jgi:hypothetical protein
MPISITNWDGGTIKVPGLYRGIPSDRYHSADITPTPALSSSMAKELTKSCPAKMWFNSSLNPQRIREDKPAFDLGTAIHAAVLEPHTYADKVAVVQADDWRTKAAREARDAARAEGKVPLLAHQDAEVQSIAAAIRSHKVASKGLSGPGEAELSGFWQDGVTGIWMKIRPDYLWYSGTFCLDLKSAATANPDEFARSAYKFGYHQQDAFYRDGIQAITGAAPKFWFIAAEKDEQALVTVCSWHDDAVEAGRILNRRAVETFARCLSTGEWPGYRNPETPDRDTAFVLRLPGYAEREVQSLIAA